MYEVGERVVVEYCDRKMIGNISGKYSVSRYFVDFYNPEDRKFVNAIGEGKTLEWDEFFIRLYEDHVSHDEWNKIIG